MTSDEVWTDGIYIELGEHGDCQLVRSASQAQDILLYGWPVRGGEAFRHALDACTGAFSGALRADEARRAFILAAEEAGLYTAASPPRYMKPAPKLAFPANAEFRQKKRGHRTYWR